MKVGKVISLILIFISGYSLRVLQVEADKAMQKECFRFGWDFHSYLPEPMCNVHANVFPLRKLREMYPTSTPFWRPQPVKPPPLPSIQPKPGGPSA